MMKLHERILAPLSKVFNRNGAIQAQAPLSRRARRRNLISLRQQKLRRGKYAPVTLAALLVLLACLLLALITGPVAIKSASQHLVPEQRIRDAMAVAAEAPPRTERGAEIERTIKEQLAQVAAAPDSSDAPALLNALGNKYRQTYGDYAAATNCYEQIIIDYPQWEHVASVYPNLITCYERMSDAEGFRWICQKMMKDFPSESQEHLFAKAKLYDQL